MAVRGPRERYQRYERKCPNSPTRSRSYLRNVFLTFASFKHRSSIRERTPLRVSDEHEYRRIFSSDSLQTRLSSSQYIMQVAFASTLFVERTVVFPPPRTFVLISNRITVGRQNGDKARDLWYLERSTSRHPTGHVRLFPLHYA